MAVTTDKPAPYAPASAILDLIERYRNKGLPSPITSEVLMRAGVSQSLIPRTLQALQALDLVDRDGRPSQTLESIRVAPEPEYKQRLTEWLDSVYADVIEFVDPSQDDETKIRDAFRMYQPHGQQPRMVSLFLGLYAAAGKAPERAARKPRQSQTVHQQPRVRAQPAPKPQTHWAHKRRKASEASDIPTPLAGLLSSLPSQGESWTKTERDRFVTTFSTVLDYCFPIEEQRHRNEETATVTNPAAA